MKEFLENYKKKDCKTWIGSMIQILVFNNLARLGFFSLLTIIGGIGIGIFQSIATIWVVLFFSGLVYLAIFILVAIAFAWIINPIRSLKNK